MREHYNIVYCSVKEVAPIFIRFSGTPPVLIFDLFNLRERGAETVTRELRQFFPSIIAKHNGCSWRHASDVWGWFWLSRGKGLRRMFQSLIFPKHAFHSWCKCSSCWITISSTQTKFSKQKLKFQPLKQHDMITPTSWIIFHCLDTKLIKILPPYLLLLNLLCCFSPMM